ncbi:hypothetical protein BDP27DRAFT_1433655 [Rhodocollybia butyracea]|uniref:Uncharacterized protein n=1 Tax=Rhodocollybia butyracea TaxID=206335 RepID=A0A9P5TWQ8_9AGAR|nr:hypothetical protein BDP27DRAFT_1433655 [Rhodocollybia butyracea]
MAKLDVSGVIGSCTRFIHAAQPAPGLILAPTVPGPLSHTVSSTVESTHSSALTQTVTIIDPLSTVPQSIFSSNESVAAAPTSTRFVKPTFPILGKPILLPFLLVLAVTLIPLATATATIPLTLSISPSLSNATSLSLSTTAPTTSSATPSPDTNKDACTLSAGLITGVVIGSMLVLALCIGIFIPEKKGHHNPGSTLPVPNPQASEPEPTSISEFPQPESLPNPLSESHLIPSLAQIQEEVNHYVVLNPSLS